VIPIATHGYSTSVVRRKICDCTTNRLQSKNIHEGGAKKVSPIIYISIHICQRSTHKASPPQTSAAGTNLRGKSLLHPLTMVVDYLTPSTMKRSILPLIFSKPVKLPPRQFSKGGFGTVPAVLLQYQRFCLLFISAESLKNHSKSQKNYKIENLILLDST
jgi:hypothetical protein